MSEEQPVVIRLRLPDGREFDCHTTVKAEYATGQADWWTEGNGGCDCNRSLYLNREYGLELGVRGDDYDVPCMPCGETIQLVSLFVNGQRIESVVSR